MTEAQVLEIFAEEVEKYPVLNRRTEDYIEDTMLGFAGFTLALVQQQFLSALILVDLRITRPIKLLVLVLVIFGELAVNGLFFDENESVEVSENTETFFSKALIYSLLTLIIMLPIKIIIDKMLSGNPIKETMTREEIESKEKCSVKLKKAGFIIGWIIFALEIYAILMFSVNFNDTAFESWMLTYLQTALTDNIGVYLCGIGIKSLYSLFLQKLIESKCLQNYGGRILNYILEFIVDLFSQLTFIQL